MKPRSDNWKEKTGASAGEEPSHLLEITHPQLAQPIRVVNDTGDIVSGGNLYQSCAFRIVMPDDLAGAMPRVPVAIDNIGKELVQWLEASDGGRGAQFRIMEVMRDAPDVIEQEYTMTLLRAQQNVVEVTGQLGYENVLDQPALAAAYTPETAPGIF